MGIVARFSAGCKQNFRKGRIFPESAREGWKPENWAKYGRKSRRSGLGLCELGVDTPKSPY